MAVVITRYFEARVFFTSAA